ncbi:TPA: TraR/DksA C4-type zinc finger protein [Morganella morganii]
MADEADISQAESDFVLSLHLNKRTQYQGESTEYCTGCGEVIPAVRRRALPGVRYCVFCSEYNERTRTR